MAPVAAGALYFLILFALGFGLGAFRVLVLEPRLGPGALYLELPVLLAASWLVAGRLVPRLARRDCSARLAMGLSALALLLGADFLTGLLLMGLSPADQLALAARPERAAGLAAQLAFAIMPLLVRRDLA